MTIRQRIATQRRRASIVGFVGFGVFVASAVISGPSSPPLVPILVGFVVFGGSVMYQLFAIRCPRCRGNLGGPLSYTSGPFGLSRRARFCLYCGVELDSPADEQPNSAMETDVKGTRGSSPRR